MSLRRQSLRTRPPASLTGRRKKQRAFVKQVTWPVAKELLDCVKPGRRKRIAVAKKLNALSADSRSAPMPSVESRMTSVHEKQISRTETLNLRSA
jgi:hypothetical protein